MFHQTQKTRTKLFTVFRVGRKDSWNSFCLEGRRGITKAIRLQELESPRLLFVAPLSESTFVMILTMIAESWMETAPSIHYWLDRTNLSRVHIKHSWWLISSDVNFHRSHSSSRIFVSSSWPAYRPWFPVCYEALLIQQFHVIPTDHFPNKPSYFFLLSLV